MTSQVWTFGHGTLPADEFVELVKGAGIERVLDIRSFPGSRRNPQHGREQMAQWLPAGGVTYQWDQRLGGRRKVDPDSRNVALRHPSFRAYADHMDTEEFHAGFDDLLDLAAQEKVAVMCSETLWWRCHRRLLSDALTLLRQVEVNHLFHDGKVRPHPPMTEARVDGDHLTYDIGETPTLLDEAQSP